MPTRGSRDLHGPASSAVASVWRLHATSPQARRCRSRRCMQSARRRLCEPRRPVRRFARVRAPDAYRASGAPRDLPLDIAFCDCFAFVPELFAFGKSDFHFRLSSREIEAKRNDRQAFFGGTAAQANDLLFVQQQFARTVRIDVRKAALLV